MGELIILKTIILMMQIQRNQNNALLKEKTKKRSLPTRVENFGIEKTT